MAELSMYAKLINSIYKSVTEKRVDLPLNYGNYDGRYIAPSFHDDITKVSIDKAGVSRLAVDRLIKVLSDDWKTGLSGLGIMYEGKLVCEYYPEYNMLPNRHVSFSMAKSIVAMGVGIAISQGIIAINDKLVDIFPAHDGIFLKHGMRDVTIKHLLTMKAGVTFDELSAYFSSGWSRAFMGSELCFEAGTGFAYDSLNTYMLAAAVEIKSGTPFMDYMKKYLFLPMGITDITWDKCPEGFVQGGWGMKLSIIDMLKLGELYRNNGRWLVDGKLKNLVPEDWVKESIICHHEFKDNNIIKGYGYQLWLLHDGAFLYNGVFGQNVYVNVDRGIVIAVSASAYALFPDCSIVEALMEFSGNDDNFTRDGFISRLKGKTHLKKPAKTSTDDIDINIFKDYFGREYCFNEYASCVVPLMTQAFYSNFMSSIKKVSFIEKREGLLFKLIDDDMSYDIMLGVMPDEYIQQNISVREKEYRISAHCDVTKKANGQSALYVSLYYPEEIAHKYMEFVFDGDEVILSVEETPDIRRFMNIAIGDKRMLRTKKMEQVQIPDYIDYKISKLISPKVMGYTVK